MQGDPKLTEQLNRVLGQTLIKINQHFLHARMFRNWGFLKLDEHECRQSIREMQQADRLLQRVLFLDGLPNLQELGWLRIGETVPEMLHCDLRLEQQACDLVREAIAHCEVRGDFVSREILEDVLGGGEAHQDWIETQLGLIEHLGLETYLQSSI